MPERIGGKKDHGILHEAHPGGDSPGPEPFSVGFNKYKSIIESVEALSLDDLDKALQTGEINVLECFELTRKLQKRTEAERDQLRIALDDASIDSRSGLLRYEFFEPDIDRLISESTISKNKRPSKIGFLILLFDIDDFKKFNDKYGHEVGNEVLSMVGKKLRQIGHRSSDLAYRYGGEELALVLSLESENDMTNDEVNTKAREKQEDLNKLLVMEIEVDDKKNGGKAIERVPISLSMGSVFFREGGDSTTTAKVLIKQADRELYNDKKNKKARMAKAREDLGLPKEEK